MPMPAAKSMADQLAVEYSGFSPSRPSGISPYRENARASRNTTPSRWPAGRTASRRGASPSRGPRSRRPARRPAAARPTPRSRPPAGRRRRGSPGPRRSAPGGPPRTRPARGPGGCRADRRTRGRSGAAVAGPGSGSCGTRWDGAAWVCPWAHHRGRPGRRSSPARTTTAPHPGGRGAVVVDRPRQGRLRGQCWWSASSSSAGLSATRVSVVSTRAAMEAALASAERVTLTGSITPSAIRSP